MCPLRAAAKKIRGYHGPVLEDYLDVESLTRDMEINGELTEFEFAGQTCVATSPNG